MKIAIKKDGTQFGNSFFLYPREIQPVEILSFIDRGFDVLEVDNTRAERLIKASSDALVHQIEVGDLLEMERGKKRC